MNASCLEDLGPVIGYRATRILATFYAGHKLHVPARPDVGHPLETLLGRSAFVALVREFSTECLCIPSEQADNVLRNMRKVAQRFAWKWSSERIADDLGLSVRRVNQMRVELIALRWIEYEQGFDTSKAQSRRQGVDVTPPRILGTSEVFGDSPPPGEMAGREVEARSR